jgi:ribose transport system permease protein
MSRIRIDWHQWAPLASLVVIAGFFAIVSPRFRNFDTLLLVLEQAPAMAIAATGLTFVLLCGEIDLSVGKIALLSACMCGAMLAWLSNGATPSAGLVTLVIFTPLTACLALGMLTGWLTSVSRLQSFIITLAMQYIADGLSSYMTRGASFPMPRLLFHISNSKIPTLGIPYSAVVAAAVMLIAAFVLKYTRFGRQVYMVGGNREAARLAGVRTERVVISCMAICALLAGISGLINSGRYGNVTVTQNQELLLNAVACAVLGGTSLAGGEGGMGRTMIGVFTFSILTVGLNRTNLSSIPNFEFLRQFVLGAVLMAALVVNGLLARRQR